MHSPLPPAKMAEIKSVLKSLLANQEKLKSINKEAKEIKSKIKESKESCKEFMYETKTSSIACGESVLELKTKSKKATLSKPNQQKWLEEYLRVNDIDTAHAAKIVDWFAAKIAESAVETEFVSVTKKKKPSKKRKKSKGDPPEAEPSPKEARLETPEEAAAHEEAAIPVDDLF